MLQFVKKTIRGTTLNAATNVMLYGGDYAEDYTRHEDPSWHQCFTCSAACVEDVTRYYYLIAVTNAVVYPGVCIDGMRHHRPGAAAYVTV